MVFVYIALPNHLHKDYTTRAAAAGIHVFCEKPMASQKQNARHFQEVEEMTHSILRFPGDRLASQPCFFHRQHPALV
jgi:glucose-fructose oxidoreductase